MVNDVYNNHLFVNQAVEAVLKIINNDKWGEEFNISGKDVLSRYQLAISVAKVFHLDNNLIHSVKSSFFPNLAPRGKNTSFNNTKMIKVLKLFPLEIEKGLVFMKNNKLNSFV